MTLVLETPQREALQITTQQRYTWLYNPQQWIEDVIQPPKLSYQQLDVVEGYRQLITARMRRQAVLAKIPGVEPLTEEELRLCQLFGISIQSGKGTGKDAIVSMLTWHFLDNGPAPRIKVMATAPTEEQLKNNLWAEMYKWQNKSPYLMDVFTHASEKIYMNKYRGKAVFATWKTCSRSADPDDQAATLSGKHEDWLLLLCDEASAIPDPVFRPIESTMTGPCNLAIVFFNPTKSKGYAINTQTTDRKNWLCYHWDAEQSEVVDPLHVQRYAEKYGRDSNMYRINVRGLPPRVDTDVLIPYDWADQCVELELEYDDMALTVGGLDVAGGGSDCSVLCVGTGPILQEIERCESIKNAQIAEWVAEYYHKLGMEALAVDTNGLGAGVAEILDDWGFNILWVNVGCISERLLDGKDHDPDRFERLRDVVWWAMRTCLQDSAISIPNNEVLIGELTTIKYEDYKGLGAKRKVESKREMRIGRGLKSPDTADAACLWNYARIKRGQKARRLMRDPHLVRRPRARDWRTV